MSITSIREYSNLRQVLLENCKTIHITNHAIRPQSLFNGVSQRVSIVLLQGFFKKNKYLFSSRYLRSFSLEKLFSTVEYHKINPDGARFFLLPKLGDDTLYRIWNKLHKIGKKIPWIWDNHSESQLYFKDYGETYWIFPLPFSPYLTPLNSFKSLKVAPQHIDKCFALFNSSLFYLFYTAISDCWHFGQWHMNEYPCNIENMPDIQVDALKQSYMDNRIIRYDKRANGDIYEYKISCSKNILDDIDTQLATCYSLSETMLDYIVNYDFVYRIGSE